MRFCQVDGTPLVDDAPAFDPYATMMARPEDLSSIKGAAEEPVVSQPEEAPPIAEPEDVLDLPEADPLKTMYVSEEEMQAVLTGETKAESDIVEIPPVAESAPTPEPPSFSVPDVPAPNFGDVSPPLSPFSSSELKDDPASDRAAFHEAQTMYQSPVTPSEPEPFQPSEPEPFQAPEPEPVKTEEKPFEPSFSSSPEPPSSPFDTPPAVPVAEWTPPPAPDASWQNKEIGSNTPFTPPAAGTGNVNQTLPIVSLVLGILSICCYISPLTGLAALITGYMGMKNANNDPQNYGGKNFAIAGMILGGLFFLVGAAYYIFVILIYAGLIAGSAIPNF